MTEKQLMLVNLRKKIEQYEHKKFKDKKELDKMTKELLSQAKAVQELKLVQQTLITEYLERIKNKYIQTLAKEKFKLYKQQTFDFEDGIYTEKENIYLSEKENEKKSMDEWEQEIKKQSTSYGMNAFEREEPVIERERERNFNLDELI